MTTISPFCAPGGFSHRGSQCSLAPSSPLASPAPPPPSRRRLASPAPSAVLPVGVCCILRLELCGIRTGIQATLKGRAQKSMEEQLLSWTMPEHIYDQTTVQNHKHYTSGLYPQSALYRALFSTPDAPIEHRNLHADAPPCIIGQQCHSCDRNIDHMGARYLLCNNYGGARACTTKPCIECERWRRQKTIERS